MNRKDEHRIVLNVGDIRIDADPAIIARMMHDLIHKPEFRKAFEADPLEYLHECGINVPKDLKEKITPETIDAMLSEFKRVGEAQLWPGVGVLVRVATRPGTSPMTRVGVMVCTETEIAGVLDKGLIGIDGLTASQRAARMRQEELERSREKPKKS
ncbi:hypothetical protein ES703_86799 [subsurface metagenome]